MGGRLLPNGDEWWLMLVTGGGMIEGGADGLLPPPLPRFCCIKQWILNQFDRLPYLEFYINISYSKININKSQS